MLSCCLQLVYKAPLPQPQIPPPTTHQAPRNKRPVDPSNSSQHHRIHDSSSIKKRMAFSSPERLPPNSPSSPRRAEALSIARTGPLPGAPPRPRPDSPFPDPLPDPPMEMETNSKKPGVATTNHVGPLPSPPDPPRAKPNTPLPDSGPTHSKVLLRPLESYYLPSPPDSPPPQPRPASLPPGNPSPDEAARDVYTNINSASKQSSTAPRFLHKLDDGDITPPCPDSPPQPRPHSPDPDPSPDSPPPGNPYPDEDTLGLAMWGRRAVRIAVAAQ